jgi:hypothetical protein
MNIFYDTEKFCQSNTSIISEAEIGEKVVVEKFTTVQNEEWQTD